MTGLTASLKLLRTEVFKVIRNHFLRLHGMQSALAYGTLHGLFAYCTGSQLFVGLRGVHVEVLL